MGHMPPSLDTHCIWVTVSDRETERQRDGETVEKKRRVRVVWCVGELVKQVRVVIETRYHSGVDKAMY